METVTKDLPDQIARLFEDQCFRNLPFVFLYKLTVIKDTPSFKTTVSETFPSYCHMYIM